MSQPDPDQRDDDGRPHIADLVVADMIERKAIGVSRYGVPLRPHNGRDPLQDLYEELLDACNYVKQRLVEDEEARNAERS